MYKRPFFRLTALASLALLSLAGCAGSSSDVDVPLPAKDQAHWVMPLDKYRLPAESSLPREAWLALMLPCMESSGYKIPVGSKPRANKETETRNNVGYKLFDAEIAKKYGYHDVAELPTSDPKDQGDILSDYVTSGGDQVEAAYSACDAKTNGVLTLVEGDENPDSANWLGIKAAKNVVEGGALKKEAAAWVECMKSLGIPTLPESPEAFPDADTSVMMGRDVGGDDNSQKTYPSPKEIEIAKQDAACRESSGYTKKKYELEFEEEAKLLRTNYGKLEAQYEKDHTALAKAQKVLDSAQ